MLFKADVEYLSCETKQGIKDPTKTYYRVLFMQGALATDFDCEESVYKRIEGLKKLQSITAVFDYNSQYRSVRLKDFTSARS